MKIIEDKEPFFAPNGLVKLLIIIGVIIGSYFFGVYVYHPIYLWLKALFAL